MNDRLKYAMEIIEKQRKEKTLTEDKTLSESTIHAIVYIIVGDIILDFLDDITY
jgi:hypothetical protein